MLPLSWHTPGVGCLLTAKTCCPHDGRIFFGLLRRSCIMMMLPRSPPLAVPPRIAINTTVALCLDHAASCTKVPLLPPLFTGKQTMRPSHALASRATFWGSGFGAEKTKKLARCMTSLAGCCKWWCCSPPINLQQGVGSLTC